MSTVSPAVEKRQTSRLSLSLSGVVKVRESKDSFWKEAAVVTSVSINGAGFHVRRKCRVGQLVSVAIPMPLRLRCYDYKKRIYSIWGLVQYCSPVSVEGAEEDDYHIGVAFIGKDAPTDFRENPEQSYRLSGIGEDGLWKVQKAERSFVTRRHVRFWASIAVSISVLDEQEIVIEDEQTQTENISFSGAAVYSNLDANIGDYVKFTCEAHNFDALAIIRNRKTGTDNRSKLHLEFVNARFPVEGIEVN